MRGAIRIERERFLHQVSRQRMTAPHDADVFAAIELGVRKIVRVAGLHALQIDGGDHCREVADGEINLACFKQCARIARGEREHARADVRCVDSL